MRRGRPWSISVLAYDGCLGAELFGLADVLLVANRVWRARGGTGPEPFDVRVVGLSGRSVRVTGGLSLRVRRPAGRPDLLVVPGFDFVQIRRK